MNKDQINENWEEMFGMLPFTDRVFDTQEINSCCLERSPSMALSRRPSSALLSALESLRSHLMGEEAIADWSDHSLDELVDDILKRLHRPLCVRLLNLETLIDMVMETHGDEIGDLMHQLHEGFSSLRGMLLEHLLQEEDTLFPWILSGNGNSAGDIIESMRQQHRSIAVKTKYVVSVASRLPISTTTCLGQQALYTTLKELESKISYHIHMENTVLYPRALGELGP
jgi:regulator of cell morphogenesis and NO signaling